MTKCVPCIICGRQPKKLEGTGIIYSCKIDTEPYTLHNLVAWAGTDSEAISKWNKLNTPKYHLIEER